MVMEYRVEFLPGVDRNLEIIDEYLSQFYPSTAGKFFEKLDKMMLLLKDNPYIGAVYLPNPKYRKLGIGDYLAFYTVDEGKRLIEVYRVLHGAQDISQYL